MEDNSDKNAKSLRKETKTQNSQHPPKDIKCSYCSYTHQLSLFSWKGRKKKKMELYQSCLIKVEIAKLLKTYSINGFDFKQTIKPGLKP